MNQLIISNAFILRLQFIENTTGTEFLNVQHSEDLRVDSFNLQLKDNDNNDNGINIKDVEFLIRDDSSRL